MKDYKLVKKLFQQIFEQEYKYNYLSYLNDIIEDVKVLEKDVSLNNIKELLKKSYKGKISESKFDQIELIGQLPSNTEGYNTIVSLAPESIFINSSDVSIMYIEINYDRNNISIIHAETGEIKQTNIE